jgi:hypothetical protein
MPVTIRCPQPACNRLLRVPEQSLGRLIRCPHCGQTCRPAAPQAVTVDLPPQTGAAVGPAVPQPGGAPPPTLSLPPAAVELPVPRTDHPSPAATLSLPPDTPAPPPAIPVAAPAQPGLPDSRQGRAAPPLAIPVAAAAQSPVVAAPVKLPERIGRFETRQRLGEGAFGIVYRAYDPHLEREVALKVAKREQLGSPQRVKRFLREAKAAANLRHPNIVPVFDSGEDGGRYYIASAFISGRSLADALQELPEGQPFPPPVPAPCRPPPGQRQPG